MKIYTKNGDKGMTSLLGGRKVSKHNIQIEAYGTIDELNSNLGLLRDYCNDVIDINFLLEIQKKLFSIGAILAIDMNKKKNDKIINISITKNDIILIENQIDSINSKLSVMTNFIIPGGHYKVSTCHICRSICRRAERRVSELKEIYKFEDEILIFINRLSDYLFVLARKLSFDTNSKEIKWVNK